jgi:hypothetical protein
MAVNGSITDLTAGEDWSVIRDITGLPVGITINAADFIVKASIYDPDTDALITCHVTTTPDAHGSIGTGSDGIVTLTFLVPKADTDTLTHARPYSYRVQYNTSNGKTKIPERGILIPQ